jgi:hypothetical protein
MAKARVYVILDVDNDFDLLDLLAAQSEEPESPFEIVDWTGNGPAAGNVRDRIRGVDNVIVICGELTHGAQAPSDELTIAREENKPYLLLWGRKGRLVSPPASADSSDKIHAWSWAVLEGQLKCV